MALLPTATTLKPSEIVEPRAKILLVDDQQDALTAMAAMLEVLGEDVLTATSADQTLKHLLKNENIAVIVLDVVMPGVDGFQLASLIRQRERHRHTPIIFLSGLYKQEAQMLRGYRSGAVDYLLKPCDPEVFRYKVKNFVDLAKQSEMLRRYAELIERKNGELEHNSKELHDALAQVLAAHSTLERESQQRKAAEATRDTLAGKLGGTPDFVESMAEGAVTLALDHSILYCNRRFADMLERSLAEVIGRPITSFLSAESQGAFETLLSEALEGSTKAELQLLSAGGELVPVQIALSRFQRADLDAVAVVLTDLRDFKRNEALLHQGRLARHILEHSTAGIAVCDVSGRITLPSSALAEMCGSNPLFNAFDDLFALRLADGRRFSVSDVLGGRVFHGEEVVLERDHGKPLTLLLSAGAIRANGVGPVGCVVTLVDISERKLVEEALRRSEKLAAAGRIAAALAHEVNNPLTAVMNLLYLLDTNIPLDQQGRDWLATACAELQRVSQIVRKTLAFYRDTNSPVPVRLTEVLDNVLALFSGAIAAKDLSVSKRYRVASPIVGYPGELQQVFNNLISNAIDALGKGGKLYLDVYATPAWRQDGQQGIRVVVADSGAGIPLDHYGRMFEPFFTTKGERGTGLGLWVTQGIVQKHGGFIRFRSRSQEGRGGTVFSVFLPVTVTAEKRADVLTFRPPDAAIRAA